MAPPSLPPLPSARGGLLAALQLLLRRRHHLARGALHLLPRSAPPPAAPAPPQPPPAPGVSRDGQPAAAELHEHQSSLVLQTDKSVLSQLQAGPVGSPPPRPAIPEDHLSLLLLPWGAQNPFATAALGPFSRLTQGSTAPLSAPCPWGQGVQIPGCAVPLPPWHTAILARGLSKKAKGKQQKGGKGREVREEVDTEEASGKERLKQRAGRRQEDDAEALSEAGAEVVLSALQARILGNNEALAKELGKLRTGRATAEVLDHVVVEAYGQKTPLSHIATVTVRDPQLLAVTLHDPELSSSALKGLQDSPMNLSPTLEAAGGASILVPVPRLTGETQKAMLKLASQACEAAKVSLRRIRKEALDAIKAMANDMAKDEQKRVEKQVESLVASATKDLDGARALKEKEIAK